MARKVATVKDEDLAYCSKHQQVQESPSLLWTEAVVKQALVGSMKGDSERRNSTTPFNLFETLIPHEPGVSENQIAS